MPIDFVPSPEEFATEAQLKEAAPETLAEAREAIYREQRAQRTQDREAARTAAAAEERAQVLAQKRVDAQQKPPSLDEVFAARPTTLEALHAQIRLMREKPAEQAEPPPPSVRQLARTELEMEAGRRASERASKQREAELQAGRKVAEAQPVASAPTPDTIHTPVYRPGEPTPGLDQNKPIQLTRGG